MHGNYSPQIGGTVLERFVVSAPRSGLNWVRFCVEKFCGLNTPGKNTLVEQDAPPENAFIRSHNPFRYKYKYWKRGQIAWTYIPPRSTVGGRTVLIIRDPLEAFVRMADGNMKKFRPYIAVIKFYSKVQPQDRAVFYYEDITKDPEAMFNLISFLNFDVRDDRDPLTLEFLKNGWEEASAESRKDYNKVHAEAGGAHTINNPTNFDFHKSKLSDDQRNWIWRALKRRLTVDEFALLERYFPEGGVSAPSGLQQITDYFRRT